MPDPSPTADGIRIEQSIPPPRTSLAVASSIAQPPRQYRVTLGTGETLQGDNVTFELIRPRFHLRAAGSLRSSAGKAGNALRGAFGMMLHQTATWPDYAHISS